MNRKNIGIFFILLANIVLLVHAFVAHHHHNENVCFENIHCTNEHSVPENETTSHQHDESSDNCVLFQLAAVPQTLEHICNCFSEFSNHSELQLFANLTHTEFDFNAYSSGIKLYSNLNQTYLSTLVYSVGMRAPPVV